jgi:hypothetical protein
MGVRSPLGFLFVSIVFLFAGCASPSSSPTSAAASSPTPTSQKKVLIVSEPAGARIEINEDYVGDAPIEVKIETNLNGSFARGATIKATPLGAGYVQPKYFDPGMPVPSRLFFDTRLGPVNTQ